MLERRLFYKQWLVGLFYEGLRGKSPLSPFGSSRQRTATASAVASLFDGGRGQYFTDVERA